MANGFEQERVNTELRTENTICHEDRVAKIADRITKLNTNLLQFQSEIEESKKDPLLKSTHRSTEGRKGLASQKSRDLNGPTFFARTVTETEPVTEYAALPPN